MQKNLLFFLFLCSSSLLVSAQTYVPMPLSNAKWYERYSSIIGGSSYYLATGGDTLVNSQTYTTIHKNDTMYQGALREDNKTVYFLPPNDSQEVVLYDFNAQVGDSLTHWFMWRQMYNVFADPHIIYLHGIDSVLVETTYRKRFQIGVMKLDSTEPRVVTTITEGIGNQEGLLLAWSEPIFEFHTDIVCLTVNEIPVWFQGTVCDRYVAVEEIASLNVRLYPNPTADRIYIEMPEINNYNILIVNALGQQLSAQKINANNAEVSLSHLPDGVYYLQVADEAKRVQTHKILKMSR